MDDIHMSFFVFLIVMSIVSLGVSLFIGYKIYTQLVSNKNRDDVEYDKIALSLTVSCIFFHLLTNIIHLICYYFHYISLNQQFIFVSYLLWDICWAISKMLLYAIFIYRLAMVFVGTVYQYSTYTVFIPLILSWIMQLLLAVAYVIIFHFEIDGISDKINHMFIVAACSIFACFDFILIVIIMYLFTIGIVKMVISMRQHSINIFRDTHNIKYDEEYQSDDDDDVVEIIEWNSQQHELLKVATHLALLGSISMLSSFIYQILWLIRFSLSYNELFYVTNTWCIDIIINIICIYLSMSIAKTYYHKMCVVCCKCHQCYFVLIECIATLKTRKKFKQIHDRMNKQKNEEAKNEGEMQKLNVNQYQDNVNVNNELSMNKN